MGICLSAGREIDLRFFCPPLICTVCMYFTHLYLAYIYVYMPHIHTGIHICMYVTYPYWHRYMYVCIHICMYVCHSSILADRYVCMSHIYTVIYVHQHTKPFYNQFWTEDVRAHPVFL